MKYDAVFATIGRNFKKAKIGGEFRAKFWFAKFYKKLPIKSNTVLVESYNGKGLSGNPFYIAQELSNVDRYGELKIFVAVYKGMMNKTRTLLDFHGLKNIEIVQRNSKLYAELLASAKFLVNNVTFPSFYIKKKGQIYLNTWHGTPLKTLGISQRSDAYAIGNCQRNFMMSDYVLFPNNFTFKRLRRDYCLNELYKNKYIITGYPRNDIFFDIKKQNRIREELGLVGKKIIVMMPTWRGLNDASNNSELNTYITHAVCEMKYKLGDDFVIFIKSHNKAKISSATKKDLNVRLFPPELETYEVLSIADCLITDYSSVMFDFACTGRKIILYAYDERRYALEHGFYFSIKKTNFVIARNTIQLLKEIQKLKEYPDYSNEMSRFVKLQTGANAEEVCQLLINQKQINKNFKIIDGKKYSNGKLNYFVFGGTLQNNGITHALNAYLKNIPQEKYNIFVSFYFNKGRKNFQNLEKIEGLNIFPLMGSQVCTYKEAFCRFLYFHTIFRFGLVKRNIYRLYKLNTKRYFVDFEPDYFVHFSGYERTAIHLMLQMKCAKIMHIHNNMWDEYLVRKNFHKPTFRRGIKYADAITVLSDDNKEGLKSIYPDLDVKKVYLIPNFLDLLHILEFSKEDIQFDEMTECTIDIDKLSKILSNPKNRIIMTIGRFSPEKQPMQLIDVFSRFSEKYPDYHLIIIGSYGPLYEDMLERIKAEERENIILIKGISNPYPILKHANLFVLPSRHEGAPVVIREAKVFDIPVITCNLSTLTSTSDNCVPDYCVNGDVDGFYDALVDFANNKIENKHFDIDNLNTETSKKMSRMLEEITKK